MNIKPIGVATGSAARPSDVRENDKGQDDEMVMWINKPRLPSTLDSVNFYRQVSVFYSEGGAEMAACPVLEVIMPHPCHQTEPSFKEPRCAVGDAPAKKEKKDKKEKKERNEKPEKPEKTEHICAARA